MFSPSQMSKSELSAYVLLLEKQNRKFVRLLNEETRSRAAAVEGLSGKIDELRKLLQDREAEIYSLKVEADALRLKLANATKLAAQRLEAIDSLNKTIQELNWRVADLKREAGVTYPYSAAKDHLTAMFRAKGLPTDVEPFKGMITRTAATLSLGKMTYQEVDDTLGEFLSMVYGR